MLLSCQNAAWAYDGNVAASGLNFSVAAGDYLCVVGENGSGKSTLLRGLLGLKTPCAGKIVYAADWRGTDIGYLPQQTAAQKDFPASVQEVVLSGRIGRLGWRPFYAAADKKAALNNLKLLGLERLRGRCFRELSGGQQRRTLLARALCAAQKLLILDEPLSGLDPSAAQNVYALLQRLRQAGLTIIMVSHDLRGALRQASHVLHLQNKQKFFGTAANYKKWLEKKHV
ncbi:zinc transport system ATP-binding protein [Candidatus Termititenax aidoneus]|uniref:Zinc transport system ATP-binding protein n=1 Tax=Termititenax aidoneus TaxID=2218524 RepID=A0A388TDE8_TERA1|nr:zinc transport system ATP-binding protein [Candidatus Termititenax aidoneus]